MIINSYYYPKNGTGNACASHGSTSGLFTYPTASPLLSFGGNLGGTPPIGSRKIKLFLKKILNPIFWQEYFLIFCVKLAWNYELRILDTTLNLTRQAYQPKTGARKTLGLA